MRDTFRELNPLAPWPTLGERDAGREPEPELYEGVPAHLADDLGHWLGDSLNRQDDLVRKVLNRFRVSWSLTTDSGGRMLRGSVLQQIVKGRLDGIESPRPLDPLSVLDAFIA